MCNCLISFECCSVNCYCYLIMFIQEVHARDCVVIKSGRKKMDKPYIAKVASLWQESGMGSGTRPLMFSFWNWTSAQWRWVTPADTCESQPWIHLDFLAATIDSESIRQQLYTRPNILTWFHPLCFFGHEWYSVCDVEFHSYVWKADQPSLIPV